jgi:RNA polymerase sigma-70 factor (ECF subfamily)
MAPPSHRRPQPDPFPLLYRAHVRLVTDLLRLAGIRTADVRDVTQEVFIIFDRELLGGLDTTGSLRRWFRRTCFRKARDHRRLAREREQPAREGAIELSDVAADAAPNPEERTMAIDMLGNVQAVLDQLPQEQRLVLVMSDVEEMPGREIAEVLEIPEGTVFSRLAAARRSFHRAWDERRASGLAAVAPFALWDADSMIKLLHQQEPLPPGFEDEVWRRLVETIPGLSASAAAGAAAGAGATAGTVFSLKQAVVGAVLSALVGAGIFAAVRPTVGAVEASKDGSASLAFAARPGDGFASSAASASSASTLVATSPPIVAAVPSASSSAVVVPAPDAEASDRLLLDKARAAMDREDYGGAQAALRRIKSARFMGDRDRLLRDVAAHLDGGR